VRLVSGLAGYLPRPVVRSAVALAVAGLGAGCAPGDVDPGAPAGTRATRLTLEASVAATSPTIGLRLRPHYVRTDGSFVPLDTGRTLAIGERAQQFPMVLDLAPCLSDPSRQVVGAGCSVQLTLELVRDAGEVLDRQVVGPMGMTPGRITNVPSVALYEIAAVRITAGAASPPGSPDAALRAEVGTALTLVATPLDATGRAVPNRTVTWSSDAPTVATIDPATGVVAPLVAGTITVTASTGARTGTARVNVVPPPSVLSVVGATLGGTGGGTVTSTPAGLACVLPGAAGSCAAAFPSDVPIVLTAAPDSASTFSTWGGSCAATTGAVCTIAPGQPRTATANFVRRRVPLALAVSGAGGGTLLVDGGTACALPFGAGSAACTPRDVDAFATVRLTAVPDGASRVLAWAGACAGTTGTECIVVPGSAASAGVTFTPRAAALTVAADPAGSGSGRVAFADGAACTISAAGTSGTCTRSGEAGAQFVLTATADAGSTFERWGGACANAAGATCTVTMPVGEAPVVTARFRATRVVEVTGTGAGTARVTSSPAGIDCTLQAGTRSGTCTAAFPVGTAVSLTATRDDFTAAGTWGGACTGAGSAPCAFTVAAGTGVQPVTLTLPRRQVALDLAFAGTGGGTLAVNGVVVCTRAIGTGQVACPSQLVEVLVPVSVSVAPDANSVFVGWSGACAGTTGPTCTLTPTAAVTVGATISPRGLSATAPLTVAPGGTGTGRVVSVPAGIDCSFDDETARGQCAAVFAPGASVRLAADAAAGSVVAGWGDACTGTDGAACQVTAPTGANDPVRASVVFDEVRYTVDVASDTVFSLEGRVTSSDGQIVCTIAARTATGACRGTYPAGTSVTLTASPVERFVSWRGDCAGTQGTVCVLAIDGPRLAVARFVRPGLTPLGTAAAPIGAARPGSR
jgi:hypothetical protein